MDTNLIENVKRVKAATVCIALRPLNFRNNVKFIGSGFFVKEGYVVTSRNVLEECSFWAERLYSETNNKSELLIYHHNPKNNYVNPDVLGFSRIQATYPIPSDRKFPDNSNYNLLGIIVPDHVKPRPYIEIKENSKLELFDDVWICGYPSGEQTMDLTKRFSGWRFSPVIQLGKITAFMPTDETPLPYGFQTDIIGTSGSSGSPIVDPDDGSVIGIAQAVLKSNLAFNLDYHYFENGKIVTKRTFFQGMAEIGLVHGTDLAKRKNIFENIKKNLDNNIYETFDFLKVSRIDFTGVKISSKVPFN